MVIGFPALSAGALFSCIEAAIPKKYKQRLKCKIINRYLVG
jgi:hypothetical protein